jgi:hypothetical protein
VLELGRVSVTLNLVALRLQILLLQHLLEAFILTYDLVAFAWLICKIGKGEERLTFKRSGSGYNIYPGRQSARAWQMVGEEPDSPSVLRVHRKFLHVFRSIHFVGGFLVHEVRGRSILECRTVRVGGDKPRVHLGWSVIEDAVLVVRKLFSDGPS